MRIAKQFRWEAAHRLPWHEGDCSNLHGHSYQMVVELEGTPDGRGILLDFQALKDVLTPLIRAWDHATIISHDDTELLHIIEDTNWKHYVLPYDTTAENLTTYVADYLCESAFDLLKSRDIQTVRVKLAETQTCYAETERTLESPLSKNMLQKVFP